MENAKFLRLPADSSAKLRDQVCELVSAAISRDLFSESEPLPSCRSLAEHLGVSRNTVYDAYCSLMDLGMVTAKDRSGYFVADTLGQFQDTIPLAQKERSATLSPLKTMLASKPRPSGMRKVDHPVDWTSYTYPFVYNQIEPERFPVAGWRESMRVAMATSNIERWTRDSAGTGSVLLVKQLQQRLFGYRGISADYDQILITNGAQHSIYLLGCLTAYAGRSVAVEDPCYPEARNAFAVAGAPVVNVPVDRNGLVVSKIPKGVGMVYTTPSHQFPTTVTMPEDRRRQLCARAEQDDFLICEDDYEAEMNFVQGRGRPIQSMEASGRAIYVGSLSKSVAPGLRIGYMVAHPDIIKEIKAIRRYMMRHPPILMQEAMANFIATGALDVHLRKMERRYRGRWEITLGAIKEFLPEFEIQASLGGTCFWLTGPPDVDTTVLAQRLKTRSVLIDEGAVFFSDPDQGRRNFRIGFAALPRAAIHDGIQVIADEVKRMRG
ncbi:MULTISPECIES: MocR-like pyridoxine biosynthesis transcription factor PdxR [Rhodobacterales]|uniref:MocR-like pyridoxine biosynthesis transcription factor PdxR n=1 Tax=Rhodobacterales TaxID=204455 RepID=UPI0015F0EFBB|nr:MULTISPECIES: PLP-dependent aminotransferase family protein [Rhodobacterales]MDO6589426.1 PLP-dependent aminotransferase family protein [Yoonia sp. 1_MG-2023]